MLPLKKKKNWSIQLKIYNCDFLVLVHGDIHWHLIHESAIISAVYNRKLKPQRLNQMGLFFFFSLEEGSVRQVGSFTTSSDLRISLTFCLAFLLVVQLFLMLAASWWQCGCWTSRIFLGAKKMKGKKQKAQTSQICSHLGSFPGSSEWCLLLVSPWPELSLSAIWSWTRDRDVGFVSWELLLCAKRVVSLRIKGGKLE